MFRAAHGLEVSPRSMALGWQPSRSIHSDRYWLGKITEHGVVPSNSPSHKTFAPDGLLVMGITMPSGVSIVPQPPRRLQQSNISVVRSMDPDSALPFRTLPN